jgi:DNA primase
LEFFLEKISLLTPHSNLGRKQFYTKKIKSLQSTQKHFNERESLSSIELKEFSLLYLLINNLDIFQENIHLIENVKLFTDEYGDIDYICGDAILIKKAIRKNW